MKNIYKIAFTLFFTLGISFLEAQTVHQVCVSEPEETECGGAGVFFPNNLTIDVGDQIEFITHYVMLGGYPNSTHEIEFDGSPANNVNLTVSGDFMNPTTSVTTQPFTTPGTFDIECKNGNHCLLATSSCTGYSVTVVGSGCDVVPDFDASATTICQGEEVQFTNTSQDANSYEWENDETQFSTDTDASYTFNDAGTFEIKLIASDGTCSEETTETITVNPNPDANIQLDPAPPYDVDENVDVTFTTTDTDANTTYSWDFCDANNESHDEDFTYSWTETGTFCVCLTLQNDDNCSNEICIDDIEVEGDDDGTANLENIETKDVVVIYPNPSDGEFTLQFDKQNTLLSLKVVDNQGRLIQKVKTSALNNENEVKLTIENSGTYFVVFETNKGFGKKKVIVSKK